MGIPGVGHLDRCGAQQPPAWGTVDPVWYDCPGASGPGAVGEGAQPPQMGGALLHPKAILWAGGCREGFGADRAPTPGCHQNPSGLCPEERKGPSFSRGSGGREKPALRQWQGVACLGAPTKGWQSCKTSGCIS